jgi:uncharacterized protein DUF2568
VKILEGANLALRFLLELSALAATAYWGYDTGSGLTRWVLAVVVPAIVVVVWALFLSPKARIELARPIRLALEFLVLGAARPRARRHRPAHACGRVCGRCGNQRHPQLRLG